MIAFARHEALSGGTAELTRDWLDGLHVPGESLY